MSRQAAILDFEQLRFAVATLIYKKPSGGDLPRKMDQLCNEHTMHYQELLEALYSEFVELNSEVKLITEWNDENYAEIVNKATIIANSIHNLSDLDLQIYSKGYATRIKFNNALSVEKDLRESAGIYKLENQNDLILSLADLGVSLVDKKELFINPKAFKALDFVQSIICAMHGIVVASDKINQTILDTQDDKIKDCENAYYHFLDSDVEDKLILFNELAIKFLSLPKDIVKYSVYKSEDATFDKILECVDVILNANENPKALQKEIDDVKNEFSLSANPPADAAMKALLLQYCGYQINPKIKSYVDNVYKAAGRVAKEEVKPQEQQKLKVQPLKETSSKQLKTKSQLAAQREKESTVANNNYDIDKEVAEYITQFFKKINQKKRGRKPKPKNIEQTTEVNEQSTAPKTEKNKKQEAEKIVEQFKKPKTKKLETVVADEESEFVQAFYNAIKKLDKKLLGNVDIVSGQFEFKNGKVKFKDLHIEIPEIDLDGSEQNELK